MADKKERDRIEAEKKRLRDKFGDPQGFDILVESIVSASRQVGMINLTITPEKVGKPLRIQLELEVAEKIAFDIMQASAAAFQDAFLMTFLGKDKVKEGAMLVQALRKHREEQIN